jgi:hypothetical protein
MRIDEALLRQRDRDEHPDRMNSRTLAEDLQLVHYDKTQGTLFGKEVDVERMSQLSHQHACS